MNVPRRRMRNFKHQIFFLMAGAICVTALIVEIILEPIVEGNFFPLGADLDWHEAPLWLFGALLNGICLSLLLTRLIMRRLDRLADAAEEIAMGNLSVRVPEEKDSEDVFGKISARFNDMAETIECLLNNERRLLSDISHELRSPLARISAAVELMTVKDSDGRHARSLERMEDEISHMNHLVGVLLEQGRNRLAIREGRTTLDASGLVAESVDGFQMQGATQKVAVEADVAPGIHIDGHPMQLRVIVENILGNALFYAPQDSVVEVGLREESGMARLDVRDRGPGVPEEKLEHIFKAFYRVDGSRARQSGGVGLGLTLVQEACIALGGSVRAENCAPGLRITVMLPVSKRPLPAGSEPDATKNSASS